jgi:hypothetical protein
MSSTCGPCSNVVPLCAQCIPGTSDPNCVRHRLDFHPWADRQMMICGRCHGRYLYSISPFGKQFLVHPALDERTILLVVWDGYKYTFADSDIVNFPEHASEAVAAYILWKIAENVDKDRGLAADRKADYERLRLALYREAREPNEVDNMDEPAAPVSGGGGFVNTAITSWSDLAALMTPLIPVNTTIMWVDASAGLLRATQVRLGTDATDTASGIQRADDYATTGKIWYNTI